MIENVMYKRILELKIDLSPIGLIFREDTELYYCTPVNANIIGWAGVDGIHYCTIPQFGDMIFSVNPMNSGDCVHPIAACFEDLIALLLSCGSIDALEQCHSFNKPQFEAYLQNQKVTSEQTELLERLKKEFKIKPIKNVFRYLKKLQSDFDYDQIPYTDDYYNPDMNPNSPLLIREWAVTFEGGFWGEQGTTGKSVPIQKSFSWGNENWTLLSVYLCDEGLVADFSVEICSDSFKAFLNKWNIQSPGFESFLKIDQERIENEHPLNIDFRSDVTCNGRKLISDSGCSITWIPASFQLEEYTPDLESRRIMNHYDLDPDKIWVVWRCSYRWEKREEQIGSLKIRFERQKKQYIGTPLGRLEKGAVIPIENPKTKETYILSVQELSDQEYDASVFRSPDMEYPTHFKALTYSMKPEIDNLSFTLRDFCEGDQPRQKSQNENGPMSMGVSFIGGAHSITGITSGTSKIACSAVHFEKDFEMNWVPIFSLKELEDIVIEVNL